jgi:hypothetical protein
MHPNHVQAFKKNPQPIKRFGYFMDSGLAPSVRKFFFIGNATITNQTVNEKLRIALRQRFCLASSPEFPVSRGKTIGFRDL